MISVILYDILAIVWFCWLTKHLYFKDNKNTYTSYNNGVVLLINLILAALWIISIPIYILPLRRASND